jgi:hypothetical protein
MPNYSGFSFGDFDPSFLEDGYGISGPQGDPIQEDVQNWDLNAWSDQSQANEDFISGPGDCNPGSAPETGTWIFGSIDGECQWIDTTTCP